MRIRAIGSSRAQWNVVERSGEMTMMVTNIPNITKQASDEPETLGKFNKDGSWSSECRLFRDLSPEQVLDFQDYAKKNGCPDSDLSVFHPVCRLQWKESE